MCGLFGFSLNGSGVSDFQRGILAATLARLNDERGGHSWGVAGYDASSSIIVLRGLHELSSHVAALAPLRAAFGHTRWATHGARVVENAHPFEIGNIIGAHNGVLSNHRPLCQRYSRDFAVDSMHLVAHLDEGRSFDDIFGYGSLQWIDRRDPGRIYLSRMESGELAVRGIGTPQACRGVIWSSDEDHLEDALDRSGIAETFAYSVQADGAVYFVDADGGPLWLDESKRCELGVSPLADAAELDWRRFGDDTGIDMDGLDDNDDERSLDWIPRRMRKGGW